MHTNIGLRPVMYFQDAMTVRPWPMCPWPMCPWP